MRVIHDPLNRPTKVKFRIIRAISENIGSCMLQMSVAIMTGQRSAATPLSVLGLFAKVRKMSVRSGRHAITWLVSRYLVEVRPGHSFRCSSKPLLFHYIQCVRSSRTFRNHRSGVKSFPRQITQWTIAYCSFLNKSWKMSLPQVRPRACTSAPPSLSFPSLTGANPSCLAKSSTGAMASSSLLDRKTTSSLDRKTTSLLDRKTTSSLDRKTTRWPPRRSDR